MTGSTKKYLNYLSTERAAARMYRELAQLTEGERREALLELADIEIKHAAYWEGLLKGKGVDAPADSETLAPSDEELLSRARRLSLDAVLPDLEQAERDAQGAYDDEPAAPPGMAADERLHEKVLAALRQTPIAPAVGPQEPDDANPSPASTPAARTARTPDEVRAALNRAEPWHHNNKSGSLRATVFGASDGLVSNTALIMGFAGSGVSSNAVLFAGVAGLLAGAFSMAAGEYVSVASQKDIYAREIAIEAAELKEKPLEEQRELELLYRAKGLSRQTAKETAEQIMSNPETALDTLAREELGLDPQSLGSPVKVAISSFAAFAVGAAVPVVPYVFFTDTTAMVLAIVLASVALVFVGGTVGRLSGLGVFRSAARQLLIGTGAAVVTFMLGQFVGAGLG